MKNILFILALAISEMLFAQAFEGKIKASLQTEQGKVDYTYFFRNDQHATDVFITVPQATHTCIYYDKSSDKICMAWENGTQKNRSKWLPTSVISPSISVNYDMLVLTETADSKDILGHQCRKYIFDFPTHKITAFIAEDIKVDLVAHTAYQKDDIVAQTILKQGLLGFALEWEIEQKIPRQISRFQSLEIEAKRPEDAVFEIGKEYQEQ